MMAIIGYFLLLAGSLFCLVSALAMLRFPDAYARLHASTKCLTAGGLLVFLGVAFLNPYPNYIPRLIILVVFYCMSSPVANHAIARAMYKRGVAEPHVVIDEYGPYLRQKEAKSESVTLSDV